MSAVSRSEATAPEGEGAERFLRGTIMERFLASREGKDSPGVRIALGGGPVAVTVTDVVRQVREITETMPFTDPGGAGRAISALTTTIPDVISRITDNVTVIP